MGRDRNPEVCCGDHHGLQYHRGWTLLAGVYGIQEPRLLVCDSFSVISMAVD